MMQERSAGFEKNDAIDMAVYSGNLLFNEQDDAHAWALALIISNLFEMVGEGESTAERFADGFNKIADFSDLHAPVLGWDRPCIAKAIHNWIDHGLALDRLQEMNSASKVRARVAKVGFLSVSEVSESDDAYRVYTDGAGHFELYFSPSLFWMYVQNWSQGEGQS